MKIRNALFLLAAALVANPCSESRGADLFQILWRGRYYTTDSSGRITAHPFTERTVVKVIAQNNGLNPRDLTLVYRPGSYDTAVVFKATGQVVADYVQLPDVTLTNSNWITQVTDGTHIIKQSFMFDEYHNAPIGSVFGVERQIHNADGNLTYDSFHGRFEYAYQTATDGFAAGVYTGTFATGRRIKDTSGS
jgi:hypothetical protein